MIFSFDIAVSDHDGLKEGITERFWLHTVVSGESWEEASLTALMMAARHGTPTKLLTCI